MENIIRKIEALLNVNGCTEAEASARLAKAQELLERHNLDMANIGGNPQGRKDQKRKGGLYSWQRNLWKAVAELNFCYYTPIKGLARGSSYEHRIIGSHANVISTEVMAQYLQETIERLAQAWAKENFYKSVFVREAIAYREGMTDRLSERLRKRREELVAEERQRAYEREREKARGAAAPNTTALTILDVISTEADLNNDYLQNWEPGTTARNRAKAEAYREDAMRRWEEQQRKQKEWDEAHPEEAAARKAKEAEELKKWVERENKRQARRNQTPPRRKQTPEEKRAGLHSYYEGRAQGEKVSIDQQAEDKRAKEAIE